MDEAKLEQFYKDLAEIAQLDRSVLTPETSLESFTYGWDSLAWMSTSALIEDVFGVRADMKQLAACKTVADIMNVAEPKS